MNSTRVATQNVTTFCNKAWRTHDDLVAREEPLELQVTYGPETGREQKVLAITMRTPGHDRELAVGFLLGEGLLHDVEELEAVHAAGPRYGDGGWTNTVRVVLRAGVTLNVERLERNFYMTSSCGVCGKTSLEVIDLQLPKRTTMSLEQIDAALICELPTRLRTGQAVFDQTGGLHAAGLFSARGDCLVIREDVGRHNAVDKVIGTQVLANRPVPADAILVVSGRASFELVQKAAAAGIGMLVSVGAPSSLAVELAVRSAVTLIGFTKQSSFNIYAGAERVSGAPSFLETKP